MVRVDNVVNVMLYHLTLKTHNQQQPRQVRDQLATKTLRIRSLSAIISSLTTGYNPVTVKLSNHIPSCITHT